MFKSLDSIASVVGIFMYLTISKCKQLLRSRKGLDYNTDQYIYIWLVSFVGRAQIRYFSFCRLNLISILAHQENQD